MNKYAILKHKADLKIKVWGKTKKELFKNALLGMEENMRYKIQEGGGKRQRKIKIHSLDLPALLVDFLSKALYFIQVKKEIYSSVKFRKFSSKALEADLLGQKIESFGVDIKAVTYHGLNVRQRKDGVWETSILFDI